MTDTPRRRRRRGGRRHRQGRMANQPAPATRAPSTRPSDPEAHRRAQAEFARAEMRKETSRPCT